MSTTILRTADAWWVDTGDGAARIETDATTLRELLAEPEKIHAARSSKETVDPRHPGVGVPGDGALPGRRADDQLRQPRQGRRAEARDHPADVLPQDLRLDQRPLRRHRPSRPRALPGL